MSKWATLDQAIESSMENVIEDAIQLISIKSVQSEAKAGAPFGEGAKELLDAVLKMGENEGFYCRDYHVGVVSVALQSGEPDLGIWLHGDVVPEGDGWQFEPYRAVTYKNCIVGRGACDNKGQLAAIFNLFKIFKELGIKLTYNPAIYVGSNEETGMKDLIGMSGNPDAKGFLNVCRPPRLSLVPDDGFPVGCGGKGGATLRLKSKTKISGFTIVAGQKESPGKAVALVEEMYHVPDALPGCKVKKNQKTEVTAFSLPRHASKPNPDGNMITQLTAALLETDLAKNEGNRAILDFIRRVSLDAYGAFLNISTKHAAMGPLTVVAQKIKCVDGYPEISLNIRYPLGIEYEGITERVSAVAEKEGFMLSDSVRGVDPYMLNPQSEIMNMLCEIANSVTGENKPPYTLSGGTYAHRLPNAYVFGTDVNIPPDDFEAGRGGAHGIDEAASLERLKTAMKIYARALIELDGMKWS